MKNVERFKEFAIVEFTKLNGDRLEDEIVLNRGNLLEGDLAEILFQEYSVELTDTDNTFPVFKIVSEGEVHEVYISMNGLTIREEDLDIILGGKDLSLDRFLNHLQVDFIDVETGKDLDIIIVEEHTPEGLRIIRDTLVDDFKLTFISSAKTGRDNIIEELAVFEVYDPQVDEGVLVNMFINGIAVSENNFF